LRTIARELVTVVRNNLTIDWTLKESVQAKLRVMVKRILRKYGYPPDKEKKATETVLEQATLLCRDWTESPAVADEGKPLFFSDLIPNEDLDIEEKFVHFLPVMSLQAVATSFREQSTPEIVGWKRINDGRKLNKEMFIAQVDGKSMEPTIPDGSYCLFRFDRGGSRNGLVVLVESKLVSDPETEKQYTIKRYKSEKKDLPGGGWQHTKITLSPDNKEFKDVVLKNVNGDDFRVVAEFVEVVS